jgi:probable F420-dependent oxidoreductase
MKVGLVLPQAPEDGAGSWREIAALARQAESGGADSLWVCDHFFHRRPDGHETGYHEAWTLLSAVAAITERVELGTLVVATSFRAPGLLAKTAATADEIAGGRLILGLGCGWYEPEYRAFGYPFDHRVGRFEEALRIIAPLVRGERVSLDGRWTSVDGAVVRPPPPRAAIPILVAAGGDRMLRLTARHADVWQTAWFGLPDESFSEERSRLHAACAAEGRDPQTLQVAVGVELRGADADAAPDPVRYLPLDASAIAAGLAAWDAEGVSYVQIVMSPMTPSTFAVALAGIRLFRGS